MRISLAATTLSLLVASLLSLPARADQLRPFTTESFAQIKSNYAGREFLVGLWSVDCPPCLVELEMMGQLLRNNPDLPFVLISTDSIANRELAVELLADFGLAEIESWMFADDFEERLRFSIDPDWYGELPRSYFFDSSHAMSSHSGIMNLSLLRDWFAREIRVD